MKRTTTNLALSLLAACSIGCGGDAGGPAVSDPATDDEANNGATNNGATNNTVDRGTNNETNNSTNNGTIAPPPAGTVVFGGSSELVWFTNGQIDIQILPGGDVEDVELVLDGMEVLAQFGEQTQYTWDTSSHAEGTYGLKLRYTLGDEVRWSEDERSVVVDRRAPTIVGATPDPGSDAATDAPITLTFDEPLDPATVNTTTVKLELTTVAVPSHTTSLSADGLTVSIDFDRSAAPLPYTAGVAIDGVADLAGNTLSDGFGYNVPAWLNSSFQSRIGDLQYFVIGASKFVVGMEAGTPDTVKVYELTNRLGASWSEVASMTAGQVYDLDADVAEGKIHVALLRQMSAGGIVVKSVQLLEFDPVSGTLVESGRRGVGVDSDDGAIALDMRELPNETRGGLAVVSGQGLSVYNFLIGTLSESTPSTFPTGNYSFVRDEDLAVHIRADSFTDVVFAKCTNGATPCYRTQFKHMGVRPVGGWQEYPLSFTTPLADSGACDEYSNFSTMYEGDLMTLLASYKRCTETQTEVYATSSDVSGTSDVTSADLVGSMPGVTDAAYTSHVAGDMQNRYALMASRTQLMVARVDATSVTWLSDAAADLDTDQILLLKRIRNPRLYTDASNKPVLVFKHDGLVHVRRAN